jgi:hypothetical protein
VNYFENTVEDRLRVRNDRRKCMVSAIRGWLREERCPRLTIIGFLGICAVLAIGIGYALSFCGVRGWGTRAFWAVLAVWPVFVLLLRWRTAVDFKRLAFDDRMDHFISFDKLAEEAATPSQP